MADVTRRIRNPLVLGLVAIGLVAGLTGCEVYDDTIDGSKARVTFVKECGPAAVRVTVVNKTPREVDVELSASRVGGADAFSLRPDVALVPRWRGPRRSTPTTPR
jgi:hypothetical protein